jgi:hypothetical protein
MIKAFFVMLVLTMMLLTFLLMISDAEAQNVIPVNIEKSKFSWDWEIGTGGQADFFRLSCASVPSGATFMSDTVGLVKEMPVNQVITIRGQYDCHVVAVNVAGESDPSNVVGLRIVGKPVNPTNFKIEAN